MQASDFFADEVAVQQISAQLGRTVLEVGEAVLRQQEARRRSVDKEMRMGSPRRSPRRHSGSDLECVDVSPHNWYSDRSIADDSDDMFADAPRPLTSFPIPCSRRLTHNDDAGVDIAETSQRRIRRHTSPLIHGVEGCSLVPSLSSLSPQRRLSASQRESGRTRDLPATSNVSSPAPRKQGVKLHSVDVPQSSSKTCPKHSLKNLEDVNVTPPCTKRSVS